MVYNFRPVPNTDQEKKWIPDQVKKNGVDTRPGTFLYIINYLHFRLWSKNNQPVLQNYDFINIIRPWYLIIDQGSQESILASNLGKT